MDVSKIASIEESTTLHPPDYAEFVKNFESVFERTPECKNLAFTGESFLWLANTRTQFSRIGKFYLDTAYNLLQQLEATNWDHRADGWILPIWFLIVHGIEMYLKAIRAGLYVALRDDEQAQKITENNHDIKTICNICKKLIQDSRKNLSPGTAKDTMQAISVVDIFIQSIYRKTTDMTFARYPVKNKNLDEHFYVLGESETVNFVRLKQQLLVVFDALDFIYDTFEYFIDFGDLGEI